MRKIDPILEQRLKVLIHSMGYELLGCELLPKGGTTVFRIYIDKPVGFVSVDDCSKVSYQVSAMLDVENPIQGRYVLEVSSPGIDRPLFEIGHFEKQLGKRVKIKLRLPINQRRQYKGILQRVEGDNIHLLVDDTKQEVILPFTEIEKANLIGDISF